MVETLFIGGVMAIFFIAGGIVEFFCNNFVW